MAAPAHPCPGHRTSRRDRPPAQRRTPTGTAGRGLAADLTTTDPDVIALLPPGTHPEPGLLESALAHFTDPSAAAVVPGVLPDRARPLGVCRGSGGGRGRRPARARPWRRPRTRPALGTYACRSGTGGPDRRVHHHRSTLLGPGPAGTPPRTGPRSPPRDGERGCKVRPRCRSSCSRGRHETDHRAGRRPLPGPSIRDHRPHPLSDSFDPGHPPRPETAGKRRHRPAVVPGRSRVVGTPRTPLPSARRGPRGGPRQLPPVRQVRQGRPVRQVRQGRACLPLRARIDADPGPGVPGVQFFEECNNRGPSTDPPSPRSLESLR